MSARELSWSSVDWAKRSRIAMQPYGSGRITPTSTRFARKSLWLSDAVRKRLQRSVGQCSLVIFSPKRGHRARYLCIAGSFIRGCRIPSRLSPPVARRRRSAPRADHSNSCRDNLRPTLRRLAWAQAPQIAYQTILTTSRVSPWGIAVFRGCPRAFVRPSVRLSAHLKIGVCAR
jgi:hypothetical protein